MEEKRNNRNIGFNFESLARSYLEKKRFEWIDSNFYTRWGEIDLIMRDHGTLVFIEVKSRSNDRFGRPEEALTPYKIKRFIRSVQWYLMKNPPEKGLIRFDVVCISGKEIRYYPNAFQAY